MSEKFSQTLLQLGYNLGMEGITLNDDRAVSLIFDERNRVEVQANNDHSMVYLLAVASPTPQGTPEEVRDAYANMLSAPMEHSVMAGASFVLDKGTSEVVLMYPLGPADLITPKYMEEALSSFVNALEHWQREAGVPATKPAEAAPPPTSGIRL